MIASAVKALLYDHDLVILPGFGGILAAYRPAVLDPVSHIVSPPSKQLSFNARLTSNDGLLATHLAAEKAISYAEGLMICEREAKQIRELLAVSRRYDMEDVGLFFLDEEGAVRFQPHNRINFLKSSFGLEPVALTPVAGNQTPVIPIGGAAGGTKIHWGRIAAVAALPIAIGLGLWYFTPEPGWKHQLASMNPFSSLNQAEYGPRKQASSAVFEEIHEAEAIEIPEEITSSELTPAEITAPESDSEEPASTAPKTSTPEPGSVISSEARIFVIAGAFEMEDNAERHAANLRSEGFDANIIGKKGKLHLVAISGHSSENEAEAGLRNAKDSGKAGAWIYIK
jgi:cell division septation protein DedD